MILCDEPWTNEPGRDMTRGSLPSLQYNHRIRKLTTEWALVPWAKDFEKGSQVENILWSEITNKHFQLNVDRILYTTERWSQDAAASKVPSRGYLIPPSDAPHTAQVLVESNPPTTKKQTGEGKSIPMQSFLETPM
jgi:hypothetical protein